MVSSHATHDILHSVQLYTESESFPDLGFPSQSATFKIMDFVMCEQLSLSNTGFP